MRKIRFTEAQMVAIVGEHDAGASVGELARGHGIHANTIRLWNKFSANALRQSEAKRQGVKASSLRDASDYSAHGQLLHVTPELEGVPGHVKHPT
jgi:transposase-like protein